jgi:hypothetical protein
MVRARRRDHAETRRHRSRNSPPSNWNLGLKSRRELFGGEPAGIGTIPDLAQALLIQKRATYVRDKQDIMTDDVTTLGLPERRFAGCAKSLHFCALGRRSDVPATVCFPRRRNRHLPCAPEVRGQLAPDLRPSQTDVRPQPIVKPSQLASALAPSGKRPGCHLQHAASASNHPAPPSGSGSTLRIQDTDTAINIRACSCESYAGRPLPWMTVPSSSPSVCVLDHCFGVDSV